MDLCVLRVDIPREQVILTLCMHALSSSLSLMTSHVRRSKLINHRKSITRRDEGVGFPPERQKRKSLMSYATDTHIYEWSMKSSFLAFFFICVSLHQLDGRQWRWCEMKDPIQITITRARPINNWLGSCRTEKKRKEWKHARKQSAFFFSLMFVRSFVPTGMIKY
jgi:hypothetical protein